MSGAAWINEGTREVSVRMFMTAEERFETARFTLEMIGLVERLLAEKATRQESMLWAELLVQARGGHVLKQRRPRGC